MQLSRLFAKVFLYTVHVMTISCRIKQQDRVTLISCDIVTFLYLNVVATQTHTDTQYVHNLMIQAVHNAIVACFILQD